MNNSPGDINFPRLLEELIGTLREMKEVQQAQETEIAALRGAVIALCTTHPDPGAALECYRVEMDAVDEAVSPSRSAKYGPALLRYWGALSHAETHRKP